MAVDVAVIGFQLGIHIGRVTSFLNFSNVLTYSSDVSTCIGNGIPTKGKGHNFQHYPPRLPP
jgi:hypothetical protein